MIQVVDIFEHLLQGLIRITSSLDPTLERSLSSSLMLPLMTGSLSIVKCSVKVDAGG